MPGPAGLVDVVRPEDPGSFVGDAVRFVRHPPGRDEEREPVRTRGSHLSSRKLECVVRGDPTEPAVPSMTEHRVRQPAELPKISRGLRTYLLHILATPDGQRSPRVQRQQVD